MDRQITSIPSLDTQDGLKLFKQTYLDWKNNNYNYLVVPKEYHDAVYNYHKGQQFGASVTRGKEDAFRKIAPIMAAPLAIPAGVAAPTIGTALGVAGALDGIKNLASNNGVRKTVNLIKQGNYKDAALSGAGDILDIVGGASLAGGALSKAVAHGAKYLSKTNAQPIAKEVYEKGIDKFRDFVGNVSSSKLYIDYNKGMDILKELIRKPGSLINEAKSPKEVYDIISQGVKKDNFLNSLPNKDISSYIAYIVDKMKPNLNKVKEIMHNLPSLLKERNILLNTPDNLHYNYEFKKPKWEKLNYINNMDIQLLIKDEDFWINKKSSLIPDKFINGIHNVTNKVKKVFTR